MIWAIVGAVCLLVAVGLLWPLFKAAVDPGIDDEGLQIFKDQLEEVDRDQQRGIITADQAHSAKQEIKRRMLSANRKPKQQQVSGGHRTLMGATILAPLAALALYAELGSPQIESQPFASRNSDAGQDAELTALTDRLKTRLEQDGADADPQGWLLLATTYQNMGRAQDAVAAWRELIALGDAPSSVWSQYAESLISAENGIVTDEADQAIAKAMELNPRNPAGTFYQALSLAQDGQVLDARRLLLDRIEKENFLQPWMQAFLNEANKLGQEFSLDPVPLPPFPEAPSPNPGPSEADVNAAAGMSPEEREAFIQSMVEGLAERLEENPEDLDGWLRLARAYTVLGDAEAAEAALNNARTLLENLPEDDPRRAAAERLLPPE